MTTEVRKQLTGTENGGLGGADQELGQQGKKRAEVMSKDAAAFAWLELDGCGSAKEIFSPRRQDRLKKTIPRHDTGLSNP